MDEFKTLVQERYVQFSLIAVVTDLGSFVNCSNCSQSANIEKKYATMLKDWSKKWEGRVEKSPECQEYSIYKGWHKVIDESSSLSKQHFQAETKLNDLANRYTCDDIISTVLFRCHRLAIKRRRGVRGLKHVLLNRDIFVIKIASNSRRIV